MRTFFPLTAPFMKADKGTEMPSAKAAEVNEPTEQAIEVVTSQPDENALVPAGENALATGGTFASEFEDVSSVFYSSIYNDGSRETAIKIYNAMNNTNGSVRDLRAPIVVTDIIAHNIELLDEQTGEMVEATRCVLICENGEAYHAVANGITSSIKKIVGIVGRAPWNPGIKMLPQQVKTRKGFYTLTLELMA